MTHYSPRPSNGHQHERVLRHNDHPRMTEALHYLFRNSKVYFRRPSASQLKVGELNFWPTTGRIHRDGDPESHPEKGLAAFASLLGLPEPGSAEDGSRARARAVAKQASQRTQNQAAFGADPCA